MERKGAMRSVPVRMRVSGVEMRDERGRMGRETRGRIVLRKGRRGSTRLIITTVIILGYLGKFRLR